MRYRLLASTAASTCQFLTRIFSNQLLFLLQLRKSNQKEAAQRQVNRVEKNLYNGLAV